MQDAQKVIMHILSKLGRQVNITRLVKLVYLTDYVHFQHFGRTLTGLEYMWDNHGPNAIGHGIKVEANELSNKGRLQCTHNPNIYGGETIEYKIAPNVNLSPISPEGELIIGDIVRQYGKLSTAVITAASKRTAPFKNAVKYQSLRMEQLTEPGHTLEGDWDAHQQEINEEGTVSLDDMRQRIGLS